MSAVHKKTESIRALSDALVESLFAAARDVDVEEVKRVLAKDPYLALRLRNGQSPLMLAAQAPGLEAVECVRALLPHSNAQWHSSDDRQSHNALMYAAKRGNVQTVQLLMNKCDVDARDYFRRTALMLAAEAGHAPVVQALLGRVEVNIEGGGGDTALEGAARAGHLDVLEALLPFASERGRYCVEKALRLAIGHAHAQCAHRLLAWAREKQTPLDDDALLICAIKDQGSRQKRRGAEEEVERLAIVRTLLATANPNTQTVQKETPLLLAAERGSLPLLLLLMEHGDPKQGNHLGETPLIVAARYGHAACVRALLPRSDPNTLSFKGRTALMEASVMGNEACVRELLAHSEVDLRSEKPTLEASMLGMLFAPGCTAFDLAMDKIVRQGCHQCADLLASCGSVERAKAHLARLPIRMDLPLTRARVERHLLHQHLAQINAHGEANVPIDQQAASAQLSLEASRESIVDASRKVPLAASVVASVSASVNASPNTSPPIQSLKDRGGQEGMDAQEALSQSQSQGVKRAARGTRGRRL